MSKVWTWLKLRAGEPTTWAGLAAIASILGANPNTINTVVQVVGLIVGGGLIATPSQPTNPAA